MSSWHNGFRVTTTGAVLVEDDNGQVWFAEEPDTAPRCTVCEFVRVEIAGCVCDRCREEGGL